MDRKGNEEIENILKDKAKIIETKSFKERWQKIESKLEFNSEQKEFVEEEIPVLAIQGAEGAKFPNKQFNYKSKIILITLCFVIAIILAIIIPLSLRRLEPVYFEPDELIQELVSEDTFYESIEKSKLDIISLSKYNSEEFSLLKSNLGTVCGGKFVINDEYNLALVNVTFYSSEVQISNFEYNDVDNYTLPNTEIYYKKINENSELVEYIALAKHKNITYELEYLSFNENITVFFDEFFS
ncbi:MAG: hypothetical protein NC131_05890 [Roseburia sp.]|nr:hypothetical protein [Roseburia sp.]